MSDERAACAHLHVEYVRINHPDRTCSDSWVCRDCRVNFWPMPAIKQQEQLITERTQRLNTLEHRMGQIAMILRDDMTDKPLTDF